MVSAAFADPTRQAVLNLLRCRALTVGELAGHLPISRPAVSQHLQVLKSAGLVEEERRGTRHFFRLNAASLAELRSLVDSLWQDALTAFSNFVEKENPKRARKKQRANRSARVGGLSHRLGFSLLHGGVFRVVAARHAAWTRLKSLRGSATPRET